MSEVVALCGGIGGAKLAVGLADRLGEQLLVICNTGDDFEHLGLTISPDFDTLLYTLAGLSNRVLGWGREDESWAFLETLTALGGESWFRLGDRDLALHIYRTQMLREGVESASVARKLCSAFGIASRICPATQQNLRTIVETESGSLSFQDYFVRHRCEPRVTAIRFVGAEAAEPSPDFVNASAPLAYVICPSNPYLSIAPILAIKGVRTVLENRRAPCAAISPIVGGRAIKGPTAKIMAELGVEVNALEVARLWAPLIDIFVLDHADRQLKAKVEALGLCVVMADTVMTTRMTKVALATTVLNALGVVS